MSGASGTVIRGSGAGPVTAAFESTMWRGLGVFRVLTLGYAVIRYVHYHDRYAHPVGGWVVMLAMTAWTGFAVLAYRLPELRRWPLVVADLALAMGTVLATRAVDTYHRVVVEGVNTIPSVWSSAAVIAAGILGGWAAGGAAALLVGLADVVESGHLTAPTVHNTVLLLVAATAIGYANALAYRAEGALAHVHRVEATIRERDRIARDIHDGVLQVLALVQRRGAEIGGEAAELGRLAGEQEAALRNLVSAVDARQAAADGEDEPTELDLRSLVGAQGSHRVQVSAPATPVMLATHAARELAAAVSAALDNVRTHVGADARAWVLVEDEGHRVVVTVRDEGPGIPQGRLDEAEAGGRLGVAKSILGRVRDLGGDGVIMSTPGEGTEVELTLPRPRQGDETEPRPRRGDQVESRPRRGDEVQPRPRREGSDRQPTEPSAP